jgi:hypothetical protein
LNSNKGVNWHKAQLSDSLHSAENVSVGSRHYLDATTSPIWTVASAEIAAVQVWIENRKSMLPYIVAGQDLIVGRKLPLNLKESVRVSEEEFDRAVIPTAMSESIESGSNQYQC